MNPENVFEKWFGLTGKTALITGSGGALGGVMARALARAGADIVLLDRKPERAAQMAAEIRAMGRRVLDVHADVLDRDALQRDRDIVAAAFGTLDILINAAGGNVPAATVPDDANLFGVPLEALRTAFDLNLFGTILPTQVYGELMAAQKQGCIVNISSMAARRPLTRVVAYGAAKAAVENFTRWLAVEMARKHGAGIRVNAIAPGFFIGEQNRRLLLNEDGSLTARGEKIIAHTPMGRFGQADELESTLIWLCGDGARFVTGVTVEVDGGFNAYSGV
jgi:NAD(P)-dependent dehydrogenase (short-subunit alcohol dehydrogenase family)